MALVPNTSPGRFDFAGALRVARELWALADAFAETERRRRGWVDHARVDFSGEYANRFVQRQHNESGTLGSMTSSLRADANEMARLWKTAMDKANAEAHKRHTADLQHKRSLAQKMADARASYDPIFDLAYKEFNPPRPPAGVAQPSPPMFAATAEPVRY